jgi:hypothetical protein
MLISRGHIGKQLDRAYFCKPLDLKYRRLPGIQPDKEGILYVRMMAQDQSLACATAAAAASTMEEHTSPGTTSKTDQACIASQV